MHQHFLIWNNKGRIRSNLGKPDTKSRSDRKIKHHFRRNAKYDRKAGPSSKPAWKLQILFSNAFESHKWHDGPCKDWTDEIWVEQWIFWCDENCRKSFWDT